MLKFKRKNWWGGSTDGSDAMYPSLELEMGPAPGSTGRGPGLHHGELDREPRALGRQRLVALSGRRVEPVMPAGRGALATGASRPGSSRLQLVAQRRPADDASS